MLGQIRRPGLLADQLRPLPDPNPGVLRGATRPDSDLQARTVLGTSGPGRHRPRDRPEQDPQPRVGEGEALRQGSGRYLPTNDQTVHFSGRPERGNKRQSQRKVRGSFEWDTRTVIRRGFSIHLAQDECLNVFDSFLNRKMIRKIMIIVKVSTECPFVFSLLF